MSQRSRRQAARAAAHSLSNQGWRRNKDRVGFSVGCRQLPNPAGGGDRPVTSTKRRSRASSNRSNKVAAPTSEATACSNSTNKGDQSVDEKATASGPLSRQGLGRYPAITAGSGATTATTSPTWNQTATARCTDRLSNTGTTYRSALTPAYTIAKSRTECSYECHTIVTYPIGSRAARPFNTSRSSRARKRSNAAPRGSSRAQQRDYRAGKSGNPAKPGVRAATKYSAGTVPAAARPRWALKSPKSTKRSGGMACPNYRVCTASMISSRMATYRRLAKPA